MCNNCERIRKQNIDIAKGKSPYQTYIKEVSKAFEDYSLRSSRQAKEEVLKYFDKQVKFHDKQDEEINKIISDVFVSNIDEDLRNTLNSNTRNIYKYFKQPLKIKKADGDRLDTDAILQIDLHTIEMLGTADIVWIMEHSNKTVISSDIQKAIQNYKEQGMTIEDVANELKKEIDISGQLERYSEKSYWKLVVNNNTQRIKSYVAINDLEEAGYSTYIWSTLDAPCPICSPYHNKIFKVEHAKSNMQKYFDGAGRGDIDAMKKADRFLTVEDVEKYPDGINGMMPPLHHNCYCEILPND